MDTCVQEMPLKDNKCNEIKTPKAKMEALDYAKFCARVQYVFSTVNDNEFNAATTMIGAPDIEVGGDVLTTIDVGVYVGMMGKHPVGVIQNGAGRFCVNLLYEGLKKFPKAEYLVSVGVCYGFNHDCTLLADVLISNKIIDLGPYRISKGGIETRGDDININDEINSIFCHNPTQVDGLKVTQNRHAKHLVGTIVSGPTLVDNADLKEKIYQQGKSKAYGGEMEGGELLRLQKNRIDMPDGSKSFVQVIIIKAVTDYADGTKCKVWQFIGAQAAFHYAKCKLEIQPVKYPSPAREKQKEGLEKKTILTEDHYGTICTQLKPCSYDWEEIAMALNFKPSEISRIQRDPMAMMKNSWMNEVIKYWLQWSPGDGRGSKELPTVQSLQQALSKTVHARIEITI